MFVNLSHFSFFLSFVFFFLKPHFIQLEFYLFFFNGSWNPTFYWLQYLKAEIQETAVEYWNMDQTDMMAFNYCNVKVCCNDLQ